MSGTIVQRMLGHADSLGERVFANFVRDGETEEIGYRALAERSVAYAQAYRAMGLIEGDVAVIILEHCPELFYSFLGAMMIGVVPTMMPFCTPKQDPEVYWHSHDQVLKRIDAKLLVTDARNAAMHRDSLPGCGLPHLLVEQVDVGQGATLLQTERASRGSGNSVYDARFHIAFLQHSSGTTSTKKGVALSHWSVVEQSARYGNMIGFTSSDVIASWLPLYHDMGLIACFMLPVITGARVVCLDPFEWVMRPDLLLDAIERERASFCWLPNFAFRHLVLTARRSSRWNLRSMRAFINCSEPCKPEVFDDFVQRFGACGVRSEMLQVCYAMAENVFAVTQTALGVAPRIVDADPDALAAQQRLVPPLPGGKAQRHISCGSVIAGSELEIRGENGGRLTDGFIGEIAIRGSSLFDGYYRRADLTAERMRDGWYHTRDMGFMFEGELFVTGRRDDMLVAYGRNYYAHDLETLAGRVTDVIPGRCVAIGVESARKGTMDIILLCESDNADRHVSIVRAVKQAVFDASALVLTDVRVLSRGSLRKTTSGKISRELNQQLYMGAVAN